MLLTLATAPLWFKPQSDSAHGYHAPPGALCQGSTGALLLLLLIASRQVCMDACPTWFVPPQSFPDQVSLVPSNLTCSLDLALQWHFIGFDAQQTKVAVLAPQSRMRTLQPAVLLPRWFVPFEMP
eukprot:2023764-Amphidinium_carterae.2